MKKNTTMTMEAKIFNLCVESAKNGKGGYTFDLKDVWQSARKKYKVAKQTVIDIFDLIIKEHEIKKGEVEGTFELVELMPKESKVLKQYRDLKAKHIDVLLLLGCGDFYCAYEEDAKVCAHLLGITLTVDSKSKVKMAGFPRHALDTYLPKLIRAGKRVAICDDIEQPSKIKKEEKFENDKKQKVVKEKNEPKHKLTECEIINLKAQKKARELYPDTFTRFSFARLDATSNKEYKNADDAIRSKADMNNLLYVIKVAEGVQYTGKTRINAYENFLAAVNG